MAKTIVFCADGTWNGPDADHPDGALDTLEDQGDALRGEVTNVVKLFANLSGHVTPETMNLQKESEKIGRDAAGAAVQVAKYLHGVGDSHNPIHKLLGGVFGMGVIARIVRGYTFLSRVYDPGDAIHIVGFSRGAYTARALAGMVARVGLLNRAAYDSADQETAYRLAIAAWCKSKSFSIPGDLITAKILAALVALLEHVVARQIPSNGMVAPVPIKSVAVWDTVGSMGIPRYAKGHRADLFRFGDSALSPGVEFGIHAMAIDERRIDFPVSRWDDRANVTQCWFVGAHADVGGGYPQTESRLSDAALSWMMEKLQHLGVIFIEPPPYVPNTIPADQAIHTPWAKPPFFGVPPSYRNVLATDAIHASVQARWRADPAYRPEAMRIFDADAWTHARIDGGRFGA